ncbi:hypothetical protein CLOP_g20667 [Closterium sp. NIES-67]|nr:hypothetical protein CLOP_g20667 [Closterium sp. NIES-67]
MYHEAKHSFAAHGIKVAGGGGGPAGHDGAGERGRGGADQGYRGAVQEEQGHLCEGPWEGGGPHEVAVDLLDSPGETKTIGARNIIIATGSDVRPLPGLQIDEKKIVSSTGALNLDAVPKKLVVVGGGVIGLELGSVWGRLGAQVTVVEFMDGIGGYMDNEVRRAFQRTLQKQGFKFMLSTKVVSADASGSGVVLEVEPAKGGERTKLDADVVLVATGRVPYTEGLGLEEAGVKKDTAGRIVVDDKFRSSVPSVFAIGDAIPGPMLAHKAEEDGIACVENLAGKHGHVNYGTVPGLFTRTLRWPWWARRRRR